jgi:TniQ
MPHIHISDPLWQTTFPFLVAPMPDEWLTGLLLRCDEANYWGSGTTFAHILRMDEKPTQHHLNLIVASGMKLDYLAQTLAVPLRSILATTYQAELARLYNVADPQMALLSPTSFSFRLCPVCMAEKRFLSRQFALPHMTTCIQHRVTLVSTCLCGTALRPFHRQTAPFVCSKCGLDWAELPRKDADKTRIEIEEKLLSYYEFFLNKGTPEILASALRLIYDSVVEKGEIRVPLPDESAQTALGGASYQRTSSLGYLVHTLWQLDLSPRDILVYTGPLPWRSVKWLTFQCPESHCPYVTMIRDRMRLLDATEDHL